MEKKDNSFALIALVAIVAIVAIVVLFSQSGTKTIYKETGVKEAASASEFTAEEIQEFNALAEEMAQENLAGDVPSPGSLYIGGLYAECIGYMEKYHEFMGSSNPYVRRNAKQWIRMYSSTGCPKFMYGY